MHSQAITTSVSTHCSMMSCIVLKWLLQNPAEETNSQLSLPNYWSNNNVHTYLAFDSTKPRWTAASWELPSSALYDNAGSSILAATQSRWRGCSGLVDKKVVTILVFTFLLVWTNLKLTGALMFTVFEAERVVQPLVAVTVNVCEDPRLIRELPTVAWYGQRNLLKPSTDSAVKFNVTDP